MNKSAMVIFHKNETNSLKKVYQLCNELHLNFFECFTLNNLIETLHILKPLIVIIDNANLKPEDIIPLAHSFKQNFFIIKSNECYNEKNIINFTNLDNLYKIINNVYQKFNNLPICPQNPSACYKFISKELESLNFSMRHLGSSYLKEVILHLYRSNSFVKNTLQEAYGLISIKFNCSTHSIERSIRIAINYAYARSLKKGEILYIFKDRPTIREITNYLLDKFLISQI